MRPTVPTQPRSSTNGHDLSSPPPPAASPWSHHHHHHQSPVFPPNFSLQHIPQNHWPPPSGNHFAGNHFPGNTSSSQQGSSEDDVRRSGGLFQQKHKHNKPEIMFGSLPDEFQNHEGLSDGNRTNNSVVVRDREGFVRKLEVSKGLGNGSSTGLGKNQKFQSQVKSNSNSHNRIGNGNYVSREQDRIGNENFAYREHDRIGNGNFAYRERRGNGNYAYQDSRGNGNYVYQEQDRRGNSGWGRQEHGVAQRPSHDGGLGRQVHGVAQRSSHDGGLGRQVHGVAQRSSHDGVHGRQEHGVVQRSSQQTPRPSPVFPSNPQGGRNWDSGNRRRNFEQNVGVKNGGYGELNTRVVTSIGTDERIIRNSPANSKSPGYVLQKSELTDQFDLPGPPTGSNLHSVKASGVEESLLKLHAEIAEIADEHGFDIIQPNVFSFNKKEHGSYKEKTKNKKNNINKIKHGYDKQNEMRMDVDGSNDNKRKKKGQNSCDKMRRAVDGFNQNKSKKKGRKFRGDKFIRSDTRGKWLLSQEMRNLKRQMICRSDIGILNAPFFEIYESLLPAEEEKAEQKQFLTLLERLVSKEWPEAQLHLFGSRANSFCLAKSDIDVCLAIDDAEINKSDLLLRLAEILQSDNLQNVQALTRTRVPIVKLMDPVTGISCDISINNVLAVVNTKLLRDYAQIDVRLRQLAFLVKHWAKSRGINETYQGTLSSYAYVLMCIHFLQQRKPAVLPCLQGMEATYSVTVDNVKCAYFDQVEKLRGFGSHNKENIAELVWAFFNYWAYCHDYANTAISVRTGSIISTQDCLICIEDPLDTSHNLGRVVDKFSIKVLREEFERAAHIMQYDPNPCVKLFEPYVPEGRLLDLQA